MFENEVQASREGSRFGGGRGLGSGVRRGGEGREVQRVRNLIEEKNGGGFRAIEAPEKKTGERHFSAAEMGIEKLIA